MRRLTSAATQFEIMRTFVVLSAAAALVAGALLFVDKHYSARHRHELARQQEAWAAEKADLEAALQQARAEATRIEAPTVVAPRVPSGAAETL